MSAVAAALWVDVLFLPKREGEQEYQERINPAKPCKTPFDPAEQVYSVGHRSWLGSSQLAVYHHLGLRSIDDDVEPGAAKDAG